MNALRSLTTRGRSLMAAGLTASVLAILFGQRDILRVGILLAALPAMATLAVARARFRLSATRHLDPPRVSAGMTATVWLRLENVAKLPTGLLLVEDRVPQALKARPRVVIDRLAAHASREFSYEVAGDYRGRFDIGPVVLRVADPFGMCQLTRAFTVRDILTVAPAIEPLPHIALGGEWSGEGDSRSRSVAAAGEDDIAVREYRYGDELRRVHWKATARHGSLMVRREEQPWESRCSLVLDTRATAHFGRDGGSDHSFEKAVTATVSIGMHLGQRGYAVRLLAGSEIDLLNPAREVGTPGGDAEGSLLDALSVVACDDPAGIEPFAQALRHGGGNGLAVVVLGLVSEADADALIRARYGMGSSIVVLIETPDWRQAEPAAREAARQGTERIATQFRRSGWRVVRLGRKQSVGDAWIQAGFAAYDEPFKVGGVA